MQDVDEDIDEANLNCLFLVAFLKAYKVQETIDCVFFSLLSSIVEHFDQH